MMKSGAPPKQAGWQRSVVPTRAGRPGGLARSAAIEAGPARSGFAALW